jgi:predicted nucleic acid-binding protein
MLFDTDVLIWALRGHEGAASLLEATEERWISAITYMELIRGARDRQQVRELRAFVEDLAFLILPLTESTTHRAVIYIEEHGLRSGFDIADALIAASAVERGLTLCTASVKHFRPISELKMQTFRA